MKSVCLSQVADLETGVDLNPVCADTHKHLMTLALLCSYGTQIMQETIVFFPITLINIQLTKHPTNFVVTCQPTHDMYAWEMLANSICFLNNNNTQH